MLKIYRIPLSGHLGSRSSLRSRLLSSVAQAETSSQEVSQQNNKKCERYPYFEEEPIPFKIMKRKKIEWGQFVNSLPTYEQKIVELNMSRQFGFLSTIFEDDYVPHYGTEYIQFYTRTHVVNELPASYYENAASNIASNIEGKFKDLLEFHCSYQGYESENARLKALLNDLNNLLFYELKNEAGHLQDATVMYNPIIDAYWLFGHPDISKANKGFLKKVLKCEDTEGLHVSRHMRSRTNPEISVRTKYPLPQVVPVDDDLCSGHYVQHFPYIPQHYGYKEDRKFAIACPGFLMSGKNDYSNICIHNLNFSDKIIVSNEKFHSDAVFHKALSSAFTHAYSLAFFHGATQFKNPERPFVVQSILTDIQNWTFALYQLNKTNFDYDNALKDPLNNVMWIQQNVKLFDKIEDGKIVGYNPEVLRLLVSMYVKNTQIVEEEDKVKFLYQLDKPKAHMDGFHEYFRTLMMERVPELKTEIYMWEQIYRIKFDRYFGKKDRFFDVPWRIKPSELVTRNDRWTRHIPRACRLDKKLSREPRINSEELYKFDYWVLKKFRDYKPGNNKMLDTTLGKKEVQKTGGDHYIHRGY